MGWVITCLIVGILWVSFLISVLASLTTKIRKGIIPDKR